MNPLKELQNYGQSVWLDYIRRSLITSGELQRMVEEDGLRGVTSNPTIFEKAITGSSDYDGTMHTLLKGDPHIDENLLFERLAIEDIQMASDILRSVYDETDGADGFVSIEVSPHLARDTTSTIAEARRLWRTISRPNLMVKVPATPEGIPAIETLIAEGININVTLMFSLAHYDAVAQAYIKGLEQCSNPRKVSSVASFFVSRIDTDVDRALEAIGTPDALSLQGKIAIANAKMAYQRFREIFYGEPFSALQQKGARLQRPLWASTGTKNPSYSDVLYIEELIGPDTVNTMPTATLNAFRNHGRVRNTLQEGLKEAEEALYRLNGLGIDLNEITEKLQVDGVASFAASFDQLMAALKEKRQIILTGHLDRLTLDLGNYNNTVEDRLNTWRTQMFACRLWQKDPGLWFPIPLPEITDRLGWLNLPEIMFEELDSLRSFAEKVRAEGVKHVVLLGMGGSSLAPEGFQHTFGNAPGYPELIVLDSTHSSAIRSVEAQVDLHKTLFLVSSKSGTTLETISLFRYFWYQVEQVTKTPGHHFVAITDPGTPLMSLAHERGFRHLFQSPSDVGGRYSALSVFGLLPAALIGMNIHRLLDQAMTMVEGCAFCVSEDENHSLPLGAALGELAQAGRDKVTFLTSPSLASFPSWLEQLITESMGKDGKGIVPVADELLGSPEDYGSDRFFVHFFLKGDKDSQLNERLKKLEEVGHPVAHICLNERAELGQELFRWEVTVAAAGAVLGIHPFNQPDIQLGKELAQNAMKQRKEEGGAPLSRNGESVSIDQPEVIVQALEALFSQAQNGDYIALHAYVAPTQETEAGLQKIRCVLRNSLKLATTLGYGPRFLHSTGQLHKGGPNSGIFLQIIDEPVEDLLVPETDYTFGSLIQAQALGDYQALKQKGRRVIRINLGSDVTRGLKRLTELLSAGLQ